jgi:hypothetical protein
MNISKLLDKIATLFKWLRAKKIRWISATVLISLISVPFIVYGISQLVQNVQWDIEEKQYQKALFDRDNRVKDSFPLAQAKWESSNITSYSFYLLISYGGRSDWEGLHGHSTGSNELPLLAVKVKDNKLVEIKVERIIANEVLGIKTNFAIDNIENNPYFTSVQDLFAIIEDALNQKVNDKVLEILRLSDKPNTEAQAQYNKLTDEERSKLEIIPLRVDAYFNYTCGFPDDIVIYCTSGNHEYNSNFEIISYKVTAFQVIEE